MTLQKSRDLGPMKLQTGRHASISTPRGCQVNDGPAVASSQNGSSGRILVSVLLAPPLRPRVAPGVERRAQRAVTPTPDPKPSGAHNGVVARRCGAAPPSPQGTAQDPSLLASPGGVLEPPRHADQASTTKAER